MHLSAKQFAEIVAQLVVDVPKPTGGPSDARRVQRVVMHSRVTIIPYEDGKARERVGVEMRDFSPRGIRFLHSTPFTRGSQFVLELPQQSGDPVNILCTVVHCETTPEGPLSMGAEFTCVLQNERSSKHRQHQPSAGERLSEADRIRHSILD